MDKYVIRTRRQPQLESPQKKEKSYVQITIESLQRVVVIEDLEKHKNILEQSQQSKENYLSSLDELSRKVPSKDVIISTGIGKTISNLINHDDPEIAQSASQLHDSWIKNVLDRKEKPRLDVRYDIKTEKLRRSAKKLLARTLVKDENDGLVLTIEKTAFNLFKLANNQYKKTMQRMVLALQYRKDYRENLKTGKLTAQDFVGLHKKLS